MATSFFGGAFFSGEFFSSGSAPAATVTPAGGVIGRKRRWVQIEDVLYHATDEDIAEILAKAPADERPKVTQIPKRKAKRILAKQALVTQSVISEPWDDEDDVEFLLLH